MKLLLMTDTYEWQVNGVTRCLENLRANLPQDVEVQVISTDDFLSVPFLGYKEIRLSLMFPRQIYRRMKAFQPDAIHIMTEWPIGLTAATLCRRRRIPYTTTFHTKYPEYLHMRNPLVREKYVHFYLHQVHDHAEKIFVSNASLDMYLERNGYSHRDIVPFGINHDIFHPWVGNLFTRFPSPRLLFVGRIAIEKNIEDFLDIDVPCTKIVVGDGPLMKKYSQKYGEVLFLGQKTAEELWEIYRSVDVFVFPSKTDTLGLVNLEAMASGLPIIAYDIEGTRWIIDQGKTGILVPEGEKLASALEKIATIDRNACIAWVQNFTWENYAKKFLKEQSLISQKIWT